MPQYSCKYGLCIVALNWDEVSDATLFHHDIPESFSERIIPRIIKYSSLALFLSKRIPKLVSRVLSG